MEGGGVFANLTPLMHRRTPKNISGGKIEERFSLFNSAKSLEKGVETMASRRVTDSESTGSRRPPATTPEARENQMISLAMDVAEKQLRDGTASSQVITHFLKLGSSTERLQQDKLKVDTGLSEKKIETLESAVRVEELMTEAISAFRSYAGQEPQEDMGEIED